MNIENETDNDSVTSQMFNKFNKCTLSITGFLPAAETRNSPKRYCSKAAGKIIVSLPYWSIWTLITF